MTAVVTALTIDVLGTPAPQGSKRHVGGGRLVESSKALRPWRDVVTWHAAAEIRRTGWVTLDEACSVTVEFFFTRPASAPRRRVRPDRGIDVDKAARAILDALTDAQAFTNDARVVDLHASKHYRPQPGAHIVVRPCTEETR